MEKTKSQPLSTEFIEKNIFMCSEKQKAPLAVLLSVYKAVSEKHTETGIAGQKREYESKGSYSFSVYTIKTTIGTLVFSKNLL